MKTWVAPILLIASLLAFGFAMMRLIQNINSRKKEQAEEAWKLAEAEVQKQKK